ncbi:MAG TPA: hypothetical protein PLU53_07225 [Bacteroidia bacterium]|nr:hypothetical protein [Bacteroidia bacterium]
MFSRRILLFTGVLLIGSCKKEKIEFDPVPSIEVSAISPGTVREYTQPLTITIKYKDGDGDLGENTSGIKNCFVTDNRIGITSAFRIQQLAPEGSSIPITGSLNIELGGQGITDTTLQSQSVSFNVYVVDRAGHTSNVVTTASVVIQ